MFHKTITQKTMTRYFSGIISGIILCFSCLSLAHAEEKSKDSSAPDKKSEKPAGKLLFDGKSLKNWEIVDFGTKMDVSVKKGELILGVGNDMNGVVFKDFEKADLPRTNYEITLDAMRVDGSDFFCGLTFPVKKDHCSLILGGWGGGLCGLSCLDGMDASENDSSTYHEFKNDKWYHIKLRVTDDRIDAWVDKEHLVKVNIKDRLISLRLETELCKPLGIASWQTEAALKNIQIRKLSDKELKEIQKPAK